MEGIQTSHAEERRQLEEVSFSIQLSAGTVISLWFIR